MTSLAIAHPFDIADSEGVSLFGLPVERSAKRSLPGSADEVLKTIRSILDEMLNDAIARRTATEFEAAVKDAFPKYVNLVIAFARIVSALVPRQTIVRISNESFSELEADIREHGLAAFGENMQERAIFTVWTLRKTSDLLESLEKAKVDDGQLDKDAEFHKEFFLHALRARFHIDCLVASMRTKHPLYPEVRPLVDDGLRSVVNAYACVKQAVDLRFPSDESKPFEAYWSAEDKELVDASMQDLTRYDVE
jgi:hypothetical protein